ncbi:Xaa-Pro aminopeptidase 1 [Trichoplax sp. H2]|nr:Xaa-Pro aminopeptidase 1 [Trichoplax sp. H2]|eukprot:RDD39589.1 Xaa-Pro aminopeptidase 1 [Trichoplax sp. H2]
MRWSTYLQIFCVALVFVVGAQGDAAKPECSQNQPQGTDDRLKTLRSHLAQDSNNIHAYIIPAGDAHQSEYIAPYSMRRKFISGFTGSAGTAIVTRTKAALWTDGRYFLQGADELDCNWILMKAGLPTTPSQTTWLNQELPAGANVGADPFLLSINSWSSYEKALATAGHKMIPISENLVDKVWLDKPSRPDAALIAMENFYTGRSWKSKIDELRGQLRAKGTFAIIVPALDNVAWLLNLRGDDVPYNPVFFSYVIVTLDTIELYIDESKVKPANIRTHLELDNCANPHCITVKPYNQILTGIKAISDGNPTGKIWLSPRTSSFAIYNQVKPEQRYLEPSPISLTKAMKNDVERQRMRETYIQESALYCQFMAWLSKEIKSRPANLTEMSADKYMENMRWNAFKDFKGLSFATISAVGPNGAIIHYKASKKSDTKLDPDQIYLLDAGGQYLGGTTDTTRTWKFTPGTAYERECFTRVLMGQIDLARAVWPEGTHGRVIDIFARQPLYQAGLQYRHGTGHGIGIFLNVHEGPGRIASGVPRYYEKPLAPGMFFSDEPGYYEAGKFGIRLETVVMVKKAKTPYNYEGMQFLDFEVITFVPIDIINLIDLKLMSKEQRVWLNKYNSDIRTKVGPYLKERKWDEGYNWMLEYTKPIPITDEQPPNGNSAYSSSNTVAIALVTATLMMIVNYFNRH